MLPLAFPAASTVATGPVQPQTWLFLRLGALGALCVATLAYAPIANAFILPVPEILGRN